MRSSRDAWDQFCGDVGRLRSAGLSNAQLDQLGQEAERLYQAGVLSEDRVLRLVQALLSPDDFARIDAIAYGIAKLFHTPLDQLAAEARSLLHTPLDQLAAEARSPL